MNLILTTRQKIVLFNDQIGQRREIMSRRPMKQCIYTASKIQEWSEKSKEAFEIIREDLTDRETVELVSKLLNFFDDI